MLNINVKCLTKTAQLPEYADLGASGMDLRADITIPIRLYPGERVLIPTGLAFEIPSGYEGQVRSRSGLAYKFGISVLNSPGTIDASYTGELKVILINNGIQNKDVFIIEPQVRIAQLVFAPIERVALTKVMILKNTERNDQGFGSTGII